jgi:hypothetical protein
MPAAPSDRRPHGGVFWGRFLMSSHPPFDTSPLAQVVQDDVYRRLGGAERVAIQFRLTSAARALTRAGIRSRHPDYSTTQVEMALARIVLGDALCRAVWPDRPLIEP